MKDNNSTNQGDDRFKHGEHAVSEGGAPAQAGRATGYSDSTKCLICVLKLIQHAVEGQRGWRVVTMDELLRETRVEKPVLRRVLDLSVSATAIKVVDGGYTGTDWVLWDFGDRILDEAMTGAQYRSAAERGGIGDAIFPHEIEEQLRAREQLPVGDHEAGIGGPCSDDESVVMLMRLVFAVLNVLRHQGLSATAMMKETAASCGDVELALAVLEAAGMVERNEGDSEAQIFWTVRTPNGWPRFELVGGRERDLIAACFPKAFAEWEEEEAKWNNEQYLHGIGNWNDDDVAE